MLTDVVSMTFRYSKDHYGNINSGKGASVFYKLPSPAYLTSLVTETNFNKFVSTYANKITTMYDTKPENRRLTGLKIKVPLRLASGSASVNCRVEVRLYFNGSSNYVASWSPYKALSLNTSTKDYEFVVNVSPYANVDPDRITNTAIYFQCQSYSSSAGAVVLSTYGSAPNQSIKYTTEITCKRECVVNVYADGEWIEAKPFIYIDGEWVEAGLFYWGGSAWYIYDNKD